jgi:hypothetical protein
MHYRDQCPFCGYEGDLAGEELKDARFVHAELLELDEHLTGLRQRMAPVEQVRNRTLRTLRRALKLPVDEPEHEPEDLWTR